jgi:hypothetical protein
MGRYVPYLAALCAVLPLIGAEVWTGYRIGLADPVLAVLSPTEQALSVRSPGGQWAMLLTLVWFALAYWRRSVRWWEIALVAVGGAAALVRVGNAWVDAVALVIPLGRQVSILHVRAWLLGSAAAASRMWRRRWSATLAAIT